MGGKRTSSWAKETVAVYSTFGRKPNRDSRRGQVSMNHYFWYHDYIVGANVPGDSDLSRNRAKTLPTQWRHKCEVKDISTRMERSRCSYEVRMSERWADDTTVRSDHLFAVFSYSVSSDVSSLVNLGYEWCGGLIYFFYYVYHYFNFFDFFLFCVCFIRRQGASDNLCRWSMFQNGGRVLFA